MTENFRSVKEFKPFEVILQKRDNHLGIHEHSQCAAQDEASSPTHDDFQIRYQQYYPRPHWDYLYTQKQYNLYNGDFLNHPLKQNNFLHGELLVWR